MTVQSSYAPSLTRSEIIGAAGQLIQRYIEIRGCQYVDRVGIDFDDVYNTVIYPEYEIGLVEDEGLGFDCKENRILGRFDVASNTAYVDASLRIGTGDPRRAFTCWHEVGGHGVLQGAWLRDRLRLHSAPSSIITTDAALTPATESVLKRHANVFTVNAAASLWLVQREIVRVFNSSHPFRYCGPCRYGFEVHGRYLTHYVGDFDELCSWIACHIKKKFWGLFTEAVSNRAKESGFVRVIKRNSRSVGKVDGTVPRISLQRVETRRWRSTRRTPRRLHAGSPSYAS